MDNSGRLKKIKRRMVYTLEQTTRSRSTNRRYLQDRKKGRSSRRLYLPCSYRRKSTANMKLDAINSENFKQLLKYQRDNLPTKGTGSWKILPKDSYLLHKKRLRKKKDVENGSQDESDQDADKKDSDTERKNDRQEPFINESSSGSSVICHYLSDSSMTTYSEEEQEKHS